MQTSRNLSMMHTASTQTNTKQTQNFLSTQITTCLPVEDKITFFPGPHARSFQQLRAVMKHHHTIYQCIRVLKQGWLLMQPQCLQSPQKMENWRPLPVHLEQCLEQCNPLLSESATQVHIHHALQLAVISGPGMTSVFQVYPGSSVTLCSHSELIAFALSQLQYENIIST